MTGRRLLAVLVACAALPVAPAGADVVLNPSGVFAVGSQPMQVAQQIALQQWGTNPCGGQIAISWSPLAPDINATSTWTNPYSSYDNPDLNGDCQIQLNSGMDFDWAKFCTVLVHEYGHLSGHPHSPDPHNVMAAFYLDPLPQCSATPDPSAPAATPAPAAQNVASTTPARAANVHPAAQKPAKRKVAHKRHKRAKHRRARARAAAADVRTFHTA